MLREACRITLLVALYAAAFGLGLALSQPVTEIIGILHDPVMHGIAMVGAVIIFVAPLVVAGTLHYYGLRKEQRELHPFAVLASVVMVAGSVWLLALTGTHRVDTQYRHAVCKDGSTDPRFPESIDGHAAICGASGGVKSYNVQTFEHPE